MKLRLRENSIRLRLLQSEIKQLQENGFVTERIQFASSQILIYKLQISDEIKEISAQFQANEITIKIPQIEAENWINTNQVGLQKEQKIDDEQTLQILIEKDFVCLDRPMDEDNLDAFPHPKMKC
jgi:hypothetical protein